MFRKAQAVLNFSSFFSNLFGLWFVVFNATFNNISSLSWLSVFRFERLNLIVHLENEDVNA
jgi:hypothetical protein